jgi:hypothetical protein
MEREVSSLHSQEPAACPYLERVFSVACVVPDDPSKSEALWNVL